MPSKSARKKSGWKDIQSKIKRSKRNKLALGVLALVVGLLIISWAIRFTQNLFSPWKLSANQHKRYIWNGEFNINLLIRSNNISVLSYNPKQEKIVLINIPDETFLEVPFGLGLWQLRSVYELGQSQKRIGGDKLLISTLTSFLAIPIDGFLDFSSLQPQRNAAELLDILKKNPFSGFNFLSALRTDLTVWELIKLKLSIGAVRFDKVKELSLVELGVLDRGNLPDGTPVWKADPVKLDSVLADLADPAISSEHKTIAVLNATDHPQLAQKAARLITNLGGNVIIMANAKSDLANAEKKLQKTKVLGEQSLTLRRLRQIFNPDVNRDSPTVYYDKIDSLNEDLVYSRAQINLLLGEDYANK